MNTQLTVCLLAAISLIGGATVGIAREDKWRPLAKVFASGFIGMSLSVILCFAAQDRYQYCLTRSCAFSQDRLIESYFGLVAIGLVATFLCSEMMSLWTRPRANRATQ